MGRRAVLVISLAFGVALTPAIGQAREPSGPPTFHAGSAGHRRPVLPARRQRRLRRPALPARRGLRPADRRPDRHGDHHGAGDPEPVQLQPRLRRARRCARSRSTGGGPSGAGTSGELTVVPRRGLVEGRTVHDRGPVRRGPGDPRGLRRGSSTPTTARSSSVSRTWPPPGSRSTTTRSTRPPSRSRSPCPTGLEAVSNGVLERRRERRGSTTWTWDARSRWRRTSP